MSLTLDDLSIKNANNAENPATTNGKNLKAVSIADIPTTVAKNNDEDIQPGYIDSQFSALDGLVGQAKAARINYNEQHKNDAVEANLEDFDPSSLDDGPIMPEATAPVSSTVTDISSALSTASASSDETTDGDYEETPDQDVAETEEAPVAAVKKEETTKPNKKMSKEEKEENAFNHIFDDDDEEDNDLLKVINGDDDNSSNETNENEEQPELTEEERKKIVDEYKENVTKFYADKRVSINTSGFKVSGKTISISDLLNVKEPDKRVSDWIQTTAKKPFSTVEYKGLELQKINPNNTRNRNAVNSKKEIYRTLYNHIVGAPKDGFEAWLKTTPYSDVGQYYFGAYKATFGDLNVITYQCPSADCNNVFIQEQPIESMYEIDEDFKEEFEKIYNGDTSFVVEDKEEIIPVSDQFAIGWHAEPSIYSIEIEPLLIDQETQEKYSRIINLIPFIGRMYYIDAERSEFIPIDEKPIAKNLAKTIKNKLALYYNILMSLNADQLAVPQLRVYNYAEKEDKIKFFEPECKCPKCGRVIEKQATNAVTLLFNRAQSPLAANS